MVVQLKVQGRLSSWCKAEEHIGCAKQMIGTDGKKFKCQCGCHPAKEDLGVKRDRRREEDEQWA